MSNSKKQYWKGLEQLRNDPSFVKYADKEFPEYLPINQKKADANSDETGSSRRDFLKMMGFSVAAASLAACEAPVRRAIPYLNKPEEIDPGIPNYYASNFTLGGDYCSVVVKTREGRPIKIEGNKMSKLTYGGVSAQVEASVLSLYDQERLRGPYVGGSLSDWETLDSEVMSKLASSRNIRVIHNSLYSPTLRKAGGAFLEKYAGSKAVAYDPQSAHGMLKANEASFGKAAVPFYDFSKAEVIVSLAADFLGTWIAPVAYAHQYAQGRKLDGGKKTMSKHYQFESNMSVTGSNADYRTPVRPSQQGLIVASLYNMIAAKAGAQTVNTEAIEVAFLESAAESLWNARGKSLVVSGSNDQNIQMLVNSINELLGNYGQTIDLQQPVHYRQGNDEEMAQFVEDVSGGKVDAVIFFNCNPVYDHPQGGLLAAELQKVGLKISTSDRMDETASLCDYVAPDNHYLESWGDAEPRSGTFSLRQPVITPLFDTRQAESTALKWGGATDIDFYNMLRDTWRTDMFPRSGASDFETFWNQTLFDGEVVLGAAPAANSEAGTDEASTAEATANSDAAMEAEAAPSMGVNLSAIASAIASAYSSNSTENELVIYQKVGLGSGMQANNPWLQEMPDPVTKAVWDNYLTVSQKFARENNLTMTEGHTKMANVSVNGVSVKVPILIQPGQAQGTMGLAVGYGRTQAGRVANGVGGNAYPLLANVGGSDITSGVSVEITSEKHQIAQTQTHETYMGRETVIQEAMLAEYQEDQRAGEFAPKIATWKGDEEKVAPNKISLWKHHQDEYVNHHWGMVIDMNSCTGCAACTIACQAENNIPVVGKDEVLTRREMHWLRIDRYYSSTGVEDYESLEVAAENPEVTFQPMMCQHCNNAPCETVCPVAATTHSTEGLNQMAYNRCIGTRYCANNCPYKVRRFNWFKYHDNTQFSDNTSMNNALGRMVLNPDVTVRSRGVMEKCTMCVQRIQAGKLLAKQESRRPTDADINTACASACPTDAITFGDMNNPESKIAKVLQLEYHDDHKTVEEPRAYTVLQELNVDPNVFYLRKIRNKEENNA